MFSAVRFNCFPDKREEGARVNDPRCRIKVIERCQSKSQVSEGARVIDPRCRIKVIERCQSKPQVSESGAQAQVFRRRGHRGGDENRVPETEGHGARDRKSEPCHESKKRGGVRQKPFQMQKIREI